MTEENMTPVDKKWHQYPYVWFLISIPAASVILSMVLIYLAISGRDPLVVDDYYKQGRAINKALTRNKTASEMGLVANIVMDHETGKLGLELRAKNKTVLPEILELKITHATRGELDKIVRLYRAQPGHYQGQLPTQGLQPGKWYLELATMQWRISTAATLPDEKPITLQPTQ